MLNGCLLMVVDIPCACWAKAVYLLQSMLNSSLVTVVKILCAGRGGPNAGAQEPAANQRAQAGQLH